MKLPAAGGLSTENVTTLYDAANQPRRLTTVDVDWDLHYGTLVAGSTHSPYGELLTADLGAYYPVYLNQAYEYGTRRLELTQVYQASGSGLAADMDYTWDDAGNLLKIDDTPNAAGSTRDAQCFDYDRLGRLTDAWTPSAGNCATTPTSSNVGGAAPYWTSFQFDAVGNRTSMVEHGLGAAASRTSTYSYPAAGGSAGSKPHAVTRVARNSSTVGSYSYDAAGNMTRRGRAGKAEQTLSWDAEGELASVTTSGGVAGKYVYSADGDRLVRTQNGRTTVYLPGGQELTLAGGTVTATRYYQFEGQTVALRTGHDARGTTAIISDRQQSGFIQVDQSTNTLEASVGWRSTPTPGSRGALLRLGLARSSCPPDRAGRSPRCSGRRRRRW
jgi:YD repeat-containing protein